MIFPILFLNIGFSMNTHYCCDKAVATTLALGPHNLDCGMENMKQECQKIPTEHEGIYPKPCCKDQYKVLQLDDMVQLQMESFSFDPIFSVVLVYTLFEPLIFVTKNQKKYVDHYRPFPNKRLQILFQTFLI